MSRAIVKVVRDRRGVAAVEFAMIMPLLLLLIGGIVDFSLAFWAKSLLAGSVAQGIQYAFLAGPYVSSSAIQSIVQQRLSLPTTSVNVSAPACSCLSGTPITRVAQSCSTPCTNGSTPNIYLTVSAQYTYTPIMPFYSTLTTSVMTETASARLQ